MHSIGRQIEAATAATVVSLNSHRVSSGSAVMENGFDVLSSAL